MQLPQRELPFLCGAHQCRLGKVIFYWLGPSPKVWRNFARVPVLYRARLCFGDGLVVKGFSCSCRSLQKMFGATRDLAVGDKVSLDCT